MVAAYLIERIVGRIVDLLGTGQLSYIYLFPGLAVIAILMGWHLAARHPWRAALGYLSIAAGAEHAFAAAFDGVPQVERRLAEQQIARRLNR